MVFTENNPTSASTPTVSESHGPESSVPQNESRPFKFRPQDVNSLFFAAAEKQGSAQDVQRNDQQQKRGQSKLGTRGSPKPAPASISSATGHFKLGALRRDSTCNESGADANPDAGLRPRASSSAVSTASTKSVSPDPSNRDSVASIATTPAPAAAPAAQAEKSSDQDAAAASTATAGTTTGGAGTNLSFVPSGFSWDSWDDEDDEFNANAKSKSMPRGMSAKDRFSSTLKDKMKPNSQPAKERPAPATTGAKPGTNASKPAADNDVAPWANKRMPPSSAKSISDQIKQAKEGRYHDKPYRQPPPVRNYNNARGGPSPFGQQSSGFNAAGSSTESGGDSLSRFRIKGDLPPVSSANDRFGNHFGGDRFGGRDDARYGGNGGGGYGHFDPPAPISWKQRAATVPVQTPTLAPAVHTSNSSIVPAPKPNSDSVPRQIPSRFLAKPEGASGAASQPAPTKSQFAAAPASDANPTFVPPAEVQPKKEPEEAQIDPEELKQQQHEAMKRASQEAFARRAERERKDEEERQKRIQERLKAFEKTSTPQPESRPAPAVSKKQDLRKQSQEKKTEVQPLLQGSWLERRQAALAGKPVTEPAQPVLSKSFARKQRFEPSSENNSASHSQSSQSPISTATESQNLSGRQNSAESAARETQPATTPESSVWSRKPAFHGEPQQMTVQEKREARALARAHSKNLHVKEDQKLINGLAKLATLKESLKARPVTTTPYVSLASSMSTDGPAVVSLPLNDENAPMVKPRHPNGNNQVCLIWPPTVSSNWFGTTSVVYRGLNTYLREPVHHIDDLAPRENSRFAVQYPPKVLIPGAKRAGYRKSAPRGPHPSNRELVFSARKSSLRG